VTDTRQYDAFGLQTGATGSTPTPFGFAGGWGYQSDETGLQLLGHRYYDPSTGRFLTRDPVKDGRNWYGYCENNSIRSVDPSGTMPEKVAVVLELMEIAVEEAAELIPACIRKLGIEASYWYLRQPPAVQRTIQAIISAIGQMATEAEFGPGAVSGTKLHSLAATELRGWQAAGKLEEGIELSVEQSFKGGSIVNYGTKGSVRVDVAVRFNGDITSLLDHKFGNAVLSKSRASNPNWRITEGNFTTGYSNSWGCAPPQHVFRTLTWL
jgi:RHS repeat-associated protein